MAPRIEEDDDDEFGLGSGDEAEMVALVDAANNHKRKRLESTEPYPPPRRIAVQKYASATNALATLFGMKAFRLKQEQVISRILSGESATVVFPTGGGKSLCYQVPALVFAEEDRLAGIRGEGEIGITLVVSPLIALMKDQVDALVRRGIKAASFDSSKSREEYLQTCEMLRSGELKILYCAPERLNNEGFIEQMKYVRGGVRLLAVDEAHCISEWGHAFRPDYLSAYLLHIPVSASSSNAHFWLTHTSRGIQICQGDLCRACGLPDGYCHPQSCLRHLQSIQH